MGISTDQGVNINVSQNAIENTSANRFTKLNNDDAILRQEDVASRVTEDQGERGIGNELITNTLKKAADADITKMNQQVQKNATESFKREIDMLYQQEDLGEDSSVLSNSYSSNFQNNKNLKELKNNLLTRNNYFSKLSTKQETLLEQYVSSYQAAQQEDMNPQIRGRSQQNLKQLEEQLAKEGMDEDGLSELKGDLKEASSHAGIQQQKKLKNLYEKGKHYFSSKLTKKQKELLSEFMDTYPQVLLQEEKSANRNNMLRMLRERMEQFEKQMEAGGLSKEEISKAKRAIENEMSSQEADKEGKKGKKTIFKGNKFINSALNGKQKALIKEFTTLYPKVLQSQGKAAYENSHQKLSQRVMQLEKELLREGMSSQQLYDLKMQIKYSIRSELVSQVKDAYLDRLLKETKSKELSERLPFIIAKRKEGFLHKFAFSQASLGGKDFGGFRGGYQGALSHVINQAGEELSSFAMDEILNALVKAKINPESADEQMMVIQKMAYLAHKNGASLDEFNRRMKQAVDDLGFVDFKIEDYESGGQGADDQGRQKQPDYGEYGYGEEDEREILINRYKALLMKRAIYPDSKTYLETAFKLRKTKQGLIQLGIYSPEFEEEISEDAKKIAVQKLLEMLKEALMERSTYYELAGPAFKLNEKKIKSILKNMQKLECPLSEEEFKTLRDQANNRMFDLSNRELQMVNLAYKNRKHPFYAKKRQMLVKLLERLKEESQIIGNISYDSDILSEMQPRSGKKDGLSVYVWKDIESKLDESKFLFQGTAFYTEVVVVISKILQEINQIKREVFEADLKSMQEYMEEARRKEMENKQEVQSWITELKTMLIFIDRNDKTVNRAAIRYLIEFLAAALK